MSEIDLAAVAVAAENDERAEKDKPLTPMQEIDLALKACGFGRFHIQLLGSSLIAFWAGVMVSNTTSFLLPSAECDLDMNLVQKGFLNAVPYLGMLFSSMVAGFLTDTFGRKRFLLIGKGGIFFFTVVAGSSQTYEVLVTAKFCEGVLFATAFSALMTLTSEFCHSGIRDRTVLLQSSFVAFAQVIVASMSWLILTQEWKYILFGYLVLNTWNFYLYICSLVSLSACLLYTFIPESPRYLLSQGKYDEARDVLITVYRRNTGKPAESFPYYNIWKNRTDLKPAEVRKTTLKSQLAVGLHNIKPIFRKPLGGTLALTCTCNFLIMLMYNVTRLWFPQLSTIIEHYSNGPDSGDLCQMLDTYTGDLKIRSGNDTVHEVCVPHKSGAETYINSIIMGCLCIIPFMITGLLLKTLKKKTLLLICSLISFGCTLGLRWSISKIALLLLFSTVVACSQNSMALAQNLIMEFFPTTSRSLALSIIMTSGRLGTLIGNVAFPILLDMGCAIPFFSLAGMMLFVGFLTLFLPGKKKT